MGIVILTIAVTTLYFWIGVGMQRLCEGWLEGGPRFIVIVLWPIFACAAAFRH